MAIRVYSLSEINQIREDFGSGLYGLEELSELYGSSEPTIMKVIEGEGAYGRINEDLEKLELLDTIFDAREAGYTEAQIASMLSWNLPRLTQFAGPQTSDRLGTMNAFIEKRKLF